MHQDNQLYVLVARKLAGEATAEELRHLQEFLGEHFDNEYIYEMLAAYWKQEPDALSLDDDNSPEVFNRIITSSLKKQENLPGHETIPAYSGDDLFIAAHPKPWKKWVYAAAAVTIGGVLWIYTFSPQQIEKMSEPLRENTSEVVAKKGSQSNIILPDGSKVRLNAASRLSYPGSFNSDKREVELEGEAYFDVVKDTSRPFIVHTSGIDVKVLGTSFNVKSYPADATIEATLIRGVIEVIRKNDPSAPAIILRPHQKLVFNKKVNRGGISATTDVINETKRYSANKDIEVATLPENKADSLISETSWLYNKLIFEGDTFRQLADKMERWYDVRISIADEKLLQYRFKGIFEKETVQQALSALQLTNNFQYKINNDEIEIFRK